MAILMKQGADLRRIPGNERGFEGSEPVLGGTLGLVGGLKFEERLVEIIHLGLLRAAFFVLEGAYW